jgi:hypothetical protein
MSALDVVTLIFALWGSILSTYLAIREVNKDKRKLKLNLEEIAFFQAHRLVITNIGIRPITIEQISLAILDKKEKWFADGVPSGSLWKNEEGVKPPTLPLTLEDGKTAIFYLSDAVTAEISVPNRYLGVNVFDAEGNVYSKYSEGVYNPKYHYRTGKIKPPSIFRRLSDRLYFWRQERKLKKDSDKNEAK